MPITESSITLNFPDNNYFRLCDCDGYKAIQNNFAEMDVCWYDQANDTLYIIELKNWDNNTLAEEINPNYTPEKIQEMKAGISNYRIGNLLKKSVDTTCMFMSILLGKVNGRNIQNVLHLRFQITQLLNYYQLLIGQTLIAHTFQI
jgi:hypothetical protein